MIVTVNGTETDVPEGATAEDLVTLLGHRTDRVALEIDGEICPRYRRASTVLRPGQRVELVSFVGGG